MFNRILSLGLLFVAGATVPLVQGAGNLLFNAGFELGEAGLDINRFQRPDVNPQYEFAPLVFDRSDSVSGTQSVKIVNPYSEAVNLILRDVKLKPGTAYTFSFYAKSSQQGYPVRLRVLSFSGRTSKWIADVRREIPVSTQWARYQQTFTTAAQEGSDGEYYTIYIESCRNPQDVGADLWLDGVQLEEGAAMSPWQAGNALEVAAMFVSPVQDGAPSEVEAMRKLLLLEGGQPQAYTLRVQAHNATAEPLRGEATVTVVDDFSGEVVDTVQVPLDLAANSGGSFDYTLAANRYGAFRLEVSVPEALADSFASYGDSFVVAGVYEPQPVNMDEVFYVGVNTGLSPWRANKATRGGRYVTKDAFWAKGISVHGYLNLLSKMGNRIIRDWDGEADTAFDWDVIEPVEGQFDFSAADTALALAEQHGMAFLPVLGGGIATTHRATLPEWVRERSEVRTQTPYRNRPQTLPYLPPVESWRSYVRAIAERYAGRITHYEIMNEPNADFFPEEYLVYLQAAHEEIKAADPAAKVIGFCSSGDWGLPLADFVVNSAKLGGMEYVDIVSYHPYETANMASPKMSSSQMNLSTIEVIDSFSEGREIPLWNTELYYLTNSGKSGFERLQYEPYEAAHRHLTDQGDGLGQSIAINVVTLWESDIAGHLDSHYGRRWQPTAKFAAFNALARHFEGARPVQKVPLAGNVAFYIFERNGQYLAALWSYGKVQGYTANFPDEIADFAVLDVFGNPVASEGGVVSVDGSIRYLVWENASEAALLEAVSRAAFTEIKE